ncbi:MAG: tryptophanase [Gammaproteobacteria bacterium]|nr:tryptophanase [Gammaproteobacteria bacterium]
MKYMTAEPFRIKVVEHIGRSTRAERTGYLEQAGYNVFKLRAEHVYIDCLTDSGASAMSANQWSAMMLGDESYAGCRSFYRLEESVRDVFGLPYVQPTHQGRAADNFIGHIYMRPGKYVLGNMHFDSLRGVAEVHGAHAVDLVIAEGARGDSPYHPFKGNIDVDRMRQSIAELGADQISAVIITVTCNNNGGQPVSMHNIRAVSELARAHGIPVVLDSARLAENAWFIRCREPGYADRPVKDITREMCSYCDTAIMSAKKDALVNIGGLFVTRDETVFRQANQLAIMHEGFITYGGLAGRDLEALAVGLQEGCDESYLAYRTAQVSYLGEQLKARGVPIIEPTGGHGVYVDGRRFFPHIAQAQFPSQRLVVALYQEAGVRAVELGACAFGRRDPDTGADIWPALECMRIAIARRVYTNSHLDVIAAALGDIHADRDACRGLRLVYEGPITAMRHFTAGFALL